MDITKATASDVSCVYDIVQKTIDAIYPHYYPAGAVTFFKNHHSKETISSDVHNQNVYLCFFEGACVATVTINANEINRLFVLPEYQHKGIGTALLVFAEGIVAQHYADACLHASFAAKSLYLFHGYHEIAYRTRECENGDILCVDILGKYFSAPQQPVRQ